MQNFQLCFLKIYQVFHIPIITRTLLKGGKFLRFNIGKKCMITHLQKQDKSKMWTLQESNIIIQLVFFISVTIVTETQLSTQNVISQEKVFPVWSSHSCVLLGGFHWKLGIISCNTTENWNQKCVIFLQFILWRYQVIIMVRKHGAISRSQLYSQ